MGVGTGTGVDEEGLGRKRCAASRSACWSSAMACVLDAAASRSRPRNVTLQKALADYYAGNTSLAKSEFEQVVKTDPNEQVTAGTTSASSRSTRATTSEAATDYLKVARDRSQLRSRRSTTTACCGSRPTTSTTAITYLGKAVAGERPGRQRALEPRVWRWPATRHTKADNTAATKELNRALKLNPALIKSLGLKPQAPTGGTSTTVGGGPTATTSRRRRPRPTIAGHDRLARPCLARRTEAVAVVDLIDAVEADADVDRRPDAEAGSARLRLRVRARETGTGGSGGTYVPLLLVAFAVGFGAWLLRAELRDVPYPERRLDARVVRALRRAADPRRAQPVRRVVPVPRARLAAVPAVPGAVAHRSPGC